MQQNIETTSKEVVSLQKRGLPRWLSSDICFMAGFIIIVCGAVLIVHWPVLSAEAFSFDDDQYLTENLLVQNPSWTSVRRFLTEVLEPSTVGGYYQPLTMISLMMDYALGGRTDNLRPFHLTSLALHVANTALVIVFLYLLFGQRWIAAMVGLLFGLHPMTTETIPWVSERKTLLAAFFALWCLILYVRYVRKSNWKLYFSCAVLYILALLSKPTSTPLPVLMLLMDYWPLRRLNRHTVFEKLPLLIVAGISGLITYISQSRTAVVVLPDEYGLGRIGLILCHNTIFYLYKLIWPVDLSSHYPFPEPLGLSNSMVLAGVVGTCILILLLVVSLRWMRDVLTGWLFFFIAIFPTMGVIGFTNVIAADKFVYLPSIGLLMVLVSLLGRLHNSNCVRKSVIQCLIMTLILSILASAEAITTRRYLAHWQNTNRLCEYMLRLAPNAATVHNMLGNALTRQDKFEEALIHYHQAMQLNPDDAETYHNNLGFAFYSQGDFDKAINHYQQALRLDADDAEIYSNNLGLAFQSQGKFEEAIKNYQQALLSKPDFAKAHYNLGNTFQSLGKLDEATKCYRQALRIAPSFTEAYNNLGNVLAAQDQLNEAAKCYSKALKIMPNFVQAHSNLGNVLFAQGRLDEAIRCYHQVLRFCPDDGETYYSLGFVLQSQGNLDEAIRYYRKALCTAPDFDLVHFNLGNALLAQNRLDEAISHYYEALRIKPSFVEVHYYLGIALKKAGQFKEALKFFREAVHLRPDYIGPLNEIAWILSTPPDPNLHDPD